MNLFSVLKREASSYCVLALGEKANNVAEHKQSATTALISQSNMSLFHYSRSLNGRSPGRFAASMDLFL
jgi:hypothetical protein